MPNLFWLLCANWLLAHAEEPPPQVDPKTLPVTTPVTPTEPGPFKCSIDPFIAMRAGETVNMKIKLTVPGETKLYRDQILVEVKDAAGLVPGEVVLPQGETYQDPWGGPPREVYDAETRLHLPLTAPKDQLGRVDLTISVSWQGCSDSTCYMPSGQTFNVPVRVLKGR